MQRASKESSDVGRAEETAEAINQQIRSLQEQFDADVASVSKDAEVEVETMRVMPKKTNITVKFVALGWRPR
jgi:SepF-like predicted cell division protein (DUF552 family)